MHTIDHNGLKHLLVPLRRSRTDADVLQPHARSSDLQLNPYVPEYVRYLTRGHEYGLTAVLLPAASSCGRNFNGSLAQVGA